MLQLPLVIITGSAMQHIIAGPENKLLNTSSGSNHNAAIDIYLFRYYDPHNKVSI